MAPRSVFCEAGGPPTTKTDALAEVTLLLDSPLVRVSRIDCAHPQGGCGAERGDERTHLVLLRRGGFGYHLGSRVYLGDPTTALLYRAGDSYRISHPFAGGDACSCFEIPEAYEDEVFGRRLRGPADAARAVDSVDQYRHRVLCAALEAGTPDRLAVEEQVAALCRAVLWRGAPEATRLSATAWHRVRRVQEVLLADPCAPLGLDALAAHAGCSPFHLSHLFSRACGMSLSTYRMRLRMALALERFAQGVDNLAALALDLGFSHQSHFGMAFRRHVGLTPRSARQALRPSRRAGRAGI